MSGEKRSGIEIRRLLAAWCDRHGASANDPRIAPLIDVVPPDVWREVLDGDAGQDRLRVVLRRIGDPARPNDEFWRHVRPVGDGIRTISDGGLSPDRLARTRVSMRLNDLISALRAVDRSDEAYADEVERKADVDRERRRKERDDAAFDEEGNLRPTRADIVKARHAEDGEGWGDPLEGDDAEPGDFEARVSDEPEEAEDLAEAEELDADEAADAADDAAEDDDYYDTYYDTLDDPVEGLVSALAANRNREKNRGALAAADAMACPVSSFGRLQTSPFARSRRRHTRPCP